MTLRREGETRASDPWQFGSLFSFPDRDLTVAPHDAFFGACQISSVRRKTDPRRHLSMPGEDLAFPSRLDSPKTNGRIEPGADQCLSVRREIDRCYPACVSTKRRHFI